MWFLVIQLTPLNTWLHQYIDKYTYNTSSCKIGIFENSRYHPFHSEGSPLLHPVAFLIIKSPCENNIKSCKFVAFHKNPLFKHHLHNPLFIAIIQIQKDYWMQWSIWIILCQKTLVIRGSIRELVSFTFFYNNQCDS